MDQDTTSELKGRFDRLAEVLDHLPMNRAQWTIIFLVALGALFDAVEQYNSGYAAPSLIKIWHINGTEVGLLTTVTFGAMAVGSLIAGVLGDLIGRKVTYMYNLALYTVGALVGAFAPNIEVLLLGRFIVGLGPRGGLLGGVETSWRWLLGVLVIPAVLIFYYRRYIPESPRYLVSHG